MKTKIQIKTLWGSVLFEHTTKDNSIKTTLTKAVNTGANLTGANLTGANLAGANLAGANLTDVNLTGADLRDADLTGADLKKIEPYFRIVPEEGPFIAWKKCADQHLVKIEIPAEAKRHNALGGRKCRAEFIKVLDIRNDKGHKAKSCHGQHDRKTVYEIGQIVKPDSYDPDPTRECSNGIHFFLTKQEAKDW